MACWTYVAILLEGPPPPAPPAAPSVLSQEVAETRLQWRLPRCFFPLMLQSIQGSQVLEKQLLWSRVKSRWPWPQGVVSCCLTQGFPLTKCLLGTQRSCLAAHSTTAHLGPEMDFRISLGIRSESARPCSTVPVSDMWREDTRLPCTRVPAA